MFPRSGPHHHTPLPLTLFLSLSLSLLQGDSTWETAACFRAVDPTIIPPAAVWKVGKSVGQSMNMLISQSERPWSVVVPILP